MSYVFFHQSIVQWAWETLENAEKNAEKDPRKQCTLVWLLFFNVRLGATCAKDGWWETDISRAFRENDGKVPFGLSFQIALSVTIKGN